MDALNGESGVTRDFRTLSQSFTVAKHIGLRVYAGDQVLAVSHSISENGLPWKAWP